MLVSIIPFSHSLTISPFTYIVPPIWERSIVLGGLVEIPFGKSIEQGIIAGIEEECIEALDPEKLKSILRVISSTALLAPYQLSMIFALCQRYLIPLHRILKMFLPAPLMTRLEKKNYILEQSPVFPISPLEYRIDYSKERYFSRDSLSDYAEPWSILVFPDDFFLLGFSEKSEGNRAVYRSEATAIQKSKSWIDTYEWKTMILAWTRKLLYYNLQAYRHIYYIEDAFGDEDYQYPTRLRNLDILRILADQQRLSITILTSSPTLELFAKFRDFKIHTHKPLSS